MNKFWTKLVSFVFKVYTGGDGKLRIPVGVDLPHFSITEDIGSVKVTLSSDGDALLLQAQTT